MATFALNRPDVFPEGTSVKALKRANYPQSQLPPTADVGTADATVLVTGGVATLTGLADNTTYFATATVNGRYRAVQFTTPIATADNVELDHKELTTTFAVTGVGSGNMQDVTGLTTLQFVMPARPVLLEVFAPAATSTNLGLTTLTIRKTADNAVVGQVAQRTDPTATHLRLVKRITTADFPEGSTVQLKVSAHVNTAAAGGSLIPTVNAPMIFRAVAQ